MPVPDRQENGIALFWFRRDLRLKDNHALWQALNSGMPVMPIFIFDRNILEKLEDKDDARLSFIHLQLQGIQDQLKKKGSSLHTFYGEPLEIHRELIERFPVKALYANRDYEPYGRKRDQSIYALYQQREIPFRGFKDQVIFEKSEVVKADGKPYTVFSPYMRKWKQILEENPIPKFPSEEKLEAMLPSGDGRVIALKEMGFGPTTIPFPEAVVDQKLLENYGQKRDIPSVRGTSRLGVHLRFGTMSIRHLAKKGMEHSVKWLNELIWRDFYQMILYHFPKSVDAAFKPAYDRIEWENNEGHFAAWCEGRTGYPLVDAGMRELNATGFMHNRVRMVTASFLTKHLLIDWRWGERYFARKLLDFELASNVGGWQWAASSGCDAAPYFRVFNPSLQLDKFDPDRIYVKKWVPEYGTGGYPKPIVDHKWARQRVLERFDQALKS